MKILSIGNSFSQDAQRYLHEIALNDGFDLQTVNLYIGGCSLQVHHKNMCENLFNYELEKNGQHTNEMVSICQALESNDWDVITVQQASVHSFDYASYFPYINEIVNYVRKKCPKADVYIHETWPYEDDSTRLSEVGYESAVKMFADIKDCYKKALKEVGADGVIPSGTAMVEGIKRGMKVHRDTFHASLGFGRYMIALVWYKTLTGRDITKNNFCSFDEEVSPFEREMAIEIASSV